MTVKRVPLQANNGPPRWVEALFDPFRRLAEALIEMLVAVLTYTPALYNGVPVEEVHRLSLVVAVLLSILVVAAAGLYLVIGVELIGIPYAQVRLILPRLILALGAAAVSLPILDLLIQFSEALVEAFLPRDELQVQQLAGLTTGLVLVWVINAAALLALVLLFMFRAVYLMFVAAISPLVALAWAFPHSRKYAQSFIALWFVALVIAPIDVLVLRFSLAMLQAGNGLDLDPVANWVIGVASFTLMLWIPYQLYQVSMATIGGRSTGIGRDLSSGGSGGEGSDDEWDDEDTRERRREDRDRRRRR
ncbi:hypothetical protein [Natronobacterium texcoconense]|uniref:Uncharacterized protein n=1 Tax=Natronobacterium texcoconense TaxID=1095778 RepID=A0A1H1ALL1_NATTX|nr:hypothetical protein [Natronobacterium texcoconense]SDQ40625.1 hypothetical protein SAMN04489842_0737 [Natronobacterium texcoconense]